ncbi:hypothetical protein PFICI_09627 [Pestalotiopsis fici W106-1]|uniref:CN hydrolase domain-containing protein n=1 Tax=Pestalotiopsis fici (strain W106-1 / CGMCC3.15140) TaxID=1229662 RepID=W3X195_PESFW|nr:uncharacterized protein PFICI_09627 [Pestalotiopsis fici W106-1]ETS79774.1 hypothetical protein PFICI_09627 [Pestalotiopsis fici W106-1]
MRIGCLQFAPQVGDVNNNLSRADGILDRADPEDLDLLVLPELAFSGYNFKSLREIYPYLEPTGTGITSVWARNVALKYDCAVAVGYPETADVSHKWPTSPEYYNSLIMVNKDGDAWALYRKSHLYYTDETWALEGPEGFWKGYLPGIGKLAMGICIPYKFEAPWDEFEFAAHAIRVSADVVIVSMAWLTHENRSSFLSHPGEPDLDTLTYWVQRMEPLIRRENEEEVIVIFANRCGTEDDVLYAGTSAVLGIQDGEVTVYGLLGRGEEQLLIVDTSKPAMAKLQYRPEREKDIYAEATENHANSDINSPVQSEGDGSIDPPLSSTFQSSRDPNVDGVEGMDGLNHGADPYIFDLSDVVSTASTEFSADSQFGSPISPRHSWKLARPNRLSKASVFGGADTYGEGHWQKWLDEHRDEALDASSDDAASLDLEPEPTVEFSALVEGLSSSTKAYEGVMLRPFSTKAGNIGHEHHSRISQRSW